MKRITNLFSRHWRNLHLISVFVLSFALVISHASLTPSIDQAVYILFYSPFAKLKSSFIALSSVSAENKKLLQTLVESSVAVSIHEEASRENARLRSIIGFDPPPDYTLMPAEVISIAGDYVPMAATINRGRVDSVFVDQPVINQQGLIGRIASVSTTTAVVQLLTDPTTRVAARVAESREMGIIRYSARQGMILENFPIQGTIKPDDLIISSGLGGIYPPGLKVGVVSEVFRDEQDPFCRVNVQSAVNFYSIDELFILREMTPWPD